MSDLDLPRSSKLAHPDLSGISENLPNSSESTKATANRILGNFGTTLPINERLTDTLGPVTLKADLAKIANLVRPEAPEMKEGRVVIGEGLSLLSENRGRLVMRMSSATPQDPIALMDGNLSEKDYLKYYNVYIKDEGGDPREFESRVKEAKLSGYRVLESIHSILSNNPNRANDLLMGHPEDRDKVLQALGAFLEKNYSMERKDNPLAQIGVIVTVEELRQNLKDKEFFDSIDAFLSRLSMDLSVYDANASHASNDPERLARLKAQKETDMKSVSAILDPLAQKAGMTRDEFLGGLTLEEFLSTYYGDYRSLEIMSKNPLMIFAPKKLGVCRDIGVYLAKVSADLGVKDSFSATVSWEGQAHIVNGGRDKDGRIYFQNYGDLYFAKTSNLRDALEEYDQHVMKSPVLVHYVSRGEDEGRNSIPVATRSGEQLQRLARGSDSNLSRQSESAVKNESFRIPKGLRFSIDPLDTTLEFSKETLAGTTLLRLDRLDNSQDTYNMIQDAWALHAGHQFQGKIQTTGTEVGLKLGATLAAGDLKSRSETGETMPLKEALFQISPQMAGGAALSDNIRYSYALALEVLLEHNLTREDEIIEPSSGMGTLSSEQRLSFIGKDFDAYVGIKTDSTFTAADSRDSVNNPLNLSAYHDLLAGRAGLKLKGNRLTVDSDLLVGIKGTARDGDVVMAKLGAMLDDSYFANLEGRLINSRTFLVNPEKGVLAELGTKAGPIRATLYASYVKEGDDPNHEPTLGYGATFQVIIP